jgi:hypothetical protein
LENLGAVYIVVVESEDGYSSAIQAVYKTKEKADVEAEKLQRALGDDNVVLVEEHEVLEE